MAILDPITGAETVLDDLIGAISKHITDPNERAELIGKLQQQAISSAQASDQAQAQILAAEAAQKGLINKPHLVLAWLCLIGAAFDLILHPLVMWGAYSLGYPIPAPPQIFTDQLSTLLYGVFGLGGLGVTHGLAKQWMATP